MKQLQVLMLAADDGACRKYRVDGPANALRLTGADVEVRRDVRVEAERDPDTRVITVHEVKHDVDVIVISRPLDNYAVSLTEQAHRQGMKVVIDVDDDFNEVHHLNAAFRGIDPTLSPSANRLWLERACEAADLVTVSTPALLKYGKRSVVLRNRLGDDAFSHRHSRPPVTERPRVGWAGTLLSHPEDLPVLGNAVSSLVRAHVVAFTVVGDGAGVAQQVGVRPAATGFVPLERYYEAVAASMDIGLVPLEDSRFNRAKSALKVLEYSALGIPSIASPTPENVRLADDGIGLIADSPREWKRLIKELAQNPRKRAQLGSQARRAVWERHRYATAGSEWRDAYESLLE